jgi:signal peptidase I
MQARTAITEIVEIAVLALFFYVVITFGVQTVHVIGESMYPTLDNDNYLISIKLDYRLGTQPSRGDIIIMRDPFDESKDFIKRVIALPGEKLLIRDGHVYINGRELQERYLSTNEPWVSSNSWPVGSTGDGAVMPKDSYFVMGDNRNRSSDSRVFGPVARNRIEGHAWLRIWPIRNLGPVGSRPELGPGSAALTAP